MFLPDRYVKGTCPHCRTPDQYGDNCENCGATYSPDRPDRPGVGDLGTPPGASASPSTSSSGSATSADCCASGPAPATLPAGGRATSWTSGSTAGLRDWDISRDAPYFGFEIPDAPGKYFYVWLDAPIGYMASFEQLLRARRASTSSDWLEAGQHGRAAPLHRQGHRLLPRAVLAGDAARRGLPHADRGARARLPDRQRREDVEVARHLRHGAHLPRSPAARVPALLLRGQARRGRRRHRPEPRRLRRPA